MSVIFTQAPMRISLGGGGTDLPSYYREHGGFLVAAAIDKYVYVLAHTLFHSRFRLKYSQFEEVDHPREVKHPILREVLMRHWGGPPLEIATVANLPAGTGLGSSGAFTVSLLKTLAIANRVPTTPGQMAEEAAHIEIDILGEPVGKQDPYVAAHGGICAYSFNQDDSVDVRPLRLLPETINALRDRFLLFFTGATRSASVILADQDRRTKEFDRAMIENLHTTREIGYTSCEALERGDLNAYASAMHEHWVNKRMRSPGISLPRIDDLYKLARDNGALGGKLVGAGGGGLLLIYSEDPDRTRRALEGEGAQEVRFDLDFQGCVGREHS